MSWDLNDNHAAPGWVAEPTDYRDLWVVWYARGKHYDVCETISVPGFYVDPMCTAGCCPPNGPFGTIADARVWAALNRDT